MKFYILILITGLSLFTLAAEAPNAEVLINFLTPEEGVIHYELIDKDFFNDTGGIQHGYLQEVTPSENGSYQLSQIIGELPPGEYAIRCFLDTNGNGKMDQNLLGIPKEPYGFSRNFRPRTGPPEFSDIAFTLEGRTEITVELQ